MTDQELIEAVAVEVMGWHNFQDKLIPRYPIGFWYDGLKHFETFNPLTNANHWMMVVEKMGEKEWYHSSDFNYVNKIHRHRFFKEDTDFIYADNKQPGHAICLAALEAVRRTK